MSLGAGRPNAGTVSSVTSSSSSSNGGVSGTFVPVEQQWCVAHARPVLAF